MTRDSATLSHSGLPCTPANPFRNAGYRGNSVVAPFGVRGSRVIFARQPRVNGVRLAAS